jgi:hypothetical protein
LTLTENASYKGLLRIRARYGPLDRPNAQGGLCHEASIQPAAEPLVSYQVLPITVDPSSTREPCRWDKKCGVDTWSSSRRGRVASEPDAWHAVLYSSYRGQMVQLRAINHRENSSRARASFSVLGARYCRELT